MEKNTKVLFLSFLIFIISISTVLISYFISLKYNFIEACIPNLDGCFSISRVGRNPPAIYLFMIVWLLLGFIGILDLFGFGSVANYAHLGGLMSGILFAMIYKNFLKRI